MSMANEMAMISNNAASEDDYVSRTFKKAKRIIREAAQKGNRYVCFYDVCHCCDKGYTHNKENMVVSLLKQNGFEIKEEWRIFGGNQVTPYIIW